MSQLSVMEAADVRRWLMDQGFEHVSTDGSDASSFGEQQDVWEQDGTRFRLTRDHADWWCDVSREGAEVWLDVDGVARASALEATTRVERVATLAWWIRDVEFKALCSIVRPSDVAGSSPAQGDVQQIRGAMTMLPQPVAALEAGEEAPPGL